MFVGWEPASPSQGQLGRKSSHVVSRTTGTGCPLSPGMTGFGEDSTEKGCEHRRRKVLLGTGDDAHLMINQISSSASPTIFLKTTFAVVGGWKIILLPEDTDFAGHEPVCYNHSPGRRVFSLNQNIAFENSPTPGSGHGHPLPTDHKFREGQKDKDEKLELLLRGDDLGI